MRNQKDVLVPAGRWRLTGFSYGSAKCMCCGRPIRRLYHLTNEDHKAKCAVDSTYNFPETIVIGCVCGPDVFKRSCAGFYDDPDREWNRQHAAFKDYINYIILNVQNKDIWEMVPKELSEPIDDYLEKGYQTDEHSGHWWRLRDAKKRVLRTKRPKTGPRTPTKIDLWRSSVGLVYAAKRHGLVSDDLFLTKDLEIVHNPQLGC